MRHLSATHTVASPKRLQTAALLVTLAWLIGAWILGSNTAHAQTACGQYSPCEHYTSKAKLGLNGITQVRITHNAQQRPGMREANLDCTSFKLSTAQVQRYFKRAGTITHNAQHYAGSDSPCYASGHLTLSTGQRAQWTIGIMQDAQLTLPSGRTQRLHCARCTFKPFVS
jgi:hypothetical protein